MSCSGAFLMWVLLVSAPRTGATPPTQDEIVERILTLDREMRSLLEQLPPDVRERVEQRLAETGEDSSRPLTAEPTTRPEPAPAEVSSETVPVSVRRSPACSALAFFDTDADGKVDSTDRYWRFLDLWLDRDGDGAVDDKEILSTFDRGVREIEVALDGFKDRKGRFHGVRAGENIVLDIKGNGFDAGPGGDDAVLVVDAAALSRSGWTIRTATGVSVEGIEPLRGGWRIEGEDGEVTVLGCP